MRERSSRYLWLSHETFKAARAAFAAGSLAGLAVLGACSDAPATSRIAGPSIPAPRFVVEPGALARTVQLCVNPLSSPGTYTFAVSAAGEGNSITPYASFERIGTNDALFPASYNTLQNTWDPADPLITPSITPGTELGPFAGDMILGNTDLAGGNVTLATPGFPGGFPDCAYVFVRANTSPIPANPDPFFNHPGNRLWKTSVETSNPYGTVTITPPSGTPYTVSCVNDDPGIIGPPQPQGDPGIADDPTLPLCPTGIIISSANVFHGSSVTYKFTSTNTPCPAGSFTYSIDGTSGDLLIRFDQFPAPNDNSYGANAVGWPAKRGHTFKDLTHSDHAGFQIRNTSGQIILSFLVDYLTATASTPSGYASLGVSGGDGGMLTGTATGITATTSLANNLNTLGYCVAGSCFGGGTTNLLVNSPPTISNTSYTLVAGSPYTLWDFHNTYFVRILASKVATFGTGWTANANTVQPNPTGLHNSPAKVCPAT